MNMARNWLFKRYFAGIITIGIITIIIIIIIKNVGNT